MCFVNHSSPTFGCDSALVKCHAFCIQPLFFSCYCVFIIIIIIQYYYYYSVSLLLLFSIIILLVYLWSEPCRFSGSVCQEEIVFSGRFSHASSSCVAGCQESLQWLHSVTGESAQQVTFRLEAWRRSVSFRCLSSLSVINKNTVNTGSWNSAAESKVLLPLLLSMVLLHSIIQRFYFSASTEMQPKRLHICVSLLWLCKDTTISSLNMCM